MGLIIRSSYRPLLVYLIISSVVGRVVAAGIGDKLVHRREGDGVGQAAYGSHQGNEHPVAPRELPLPPAC